MTRFRSTLLQLLCVALLFMGALPAAKAEGLAAPEAELKAAIMINMLLFIDWPTQTGTISNQLRICYLDNNAVASALTRADGKKIRNRTVRVQQKNLAGLHNCDAVYLAPENAAQFPGILSTLGELPVLLIGDSPAYFRRGVMLNLDRSADRIVFDFDLRATRKAGLQVSSKALRLARQVLE
jgi:hypothetical protein